MIGSRVWLVAVFGVCLVSVSGGVWLPGGTVVVAQRESTPSAVVGNVEHGRYLVERVVMCAECHSTRDAAGAIVPGTRLRGGSMPARVPWPGDWPLQVPRIAGLPGYTNAEALRLLTQGAIKRDGTQARAPMPRLRMTPQDAADVMAFLRAM
jgi:hypothetical protein